MEVEPPGGVHASVEEARELAGSFSPEDATESQQSSSHQNPSMLAP